MVYNSLIQPQSMFKPHPRNEYGDRKCVYCNNIFKSNSSRNCYCSNRCRFWNSVEIKDSYECWEWKNTIGCHGYGVFIIRTSIKRITLHAPRVSWMLINGDIPQNMDICHTCDNRLCVNPNHLWLGTRQQNLIDMAKKDRSSNAKITIRQAEEIKKSKDSINNLVIKYKVSYSIIWKIKNNITWKHV